MVWTCFKPVWLFNFSLSFVVSVWDTRLKFQYVIVSAVWWHHRSLIGCPARELQRWEGGVSGSPRAICRTRAVHDHTELRAEPDIHTAGPQCSAHTGKIQDAFRDPAAARPAAAAAQLAGEPAHRGLFLRHDAPAGRLLQRRHRWVRVRSAVRGVRCPGTAGAQRGDVWKHVLEYKWSDLRD